MGSNKDGVCPLCKKTEFNYQQYGEYYCNNPEHIPERVKKEEKTFELELAFEGTVKEGQERRYTVINEHDVKKYVPSHLQDKFETIFNRMGTWIEEGRKDDGKKPFNNYIVINLDEPYVNEIIEIMKRNGHWG